MIRYSIANTNSGRVNALYLSPGVDGASKVGRFHTLALIMVLVFLASCSGDQEREDDRHTRGDHVWKNQVEAIDKAREVEGVLKKATKKYKENLDQQSE